MKKIVTIIFSLFIANVLVQPTQAQAQASRSGSEPATLLNTFQYAPGCTDDGRSCDCIVAIRRRNTTDPSSYYYYRGDTNNPEPHETSAVFVDTKNDSWDYAFYVKRPGENEANQTKCEIKQSKSSKEFKPNDPLDDIDSCILSGVAGPVVGISTCNSGILGNVSLGDLNDWFLGFDLGGNWDDVSSGTAIYRGLGFSYKESDKICGWEQCGAGGDPNKPNEIGCRDIGNSRRGFSTAGWFTLVEGFSDKKVTRVEFKTGNDVICSLGFIKKDAGDPTIFGNTDPEKFSLCEQISGNAISAEDIDSPKGKCYACVEKNGIWTALGCIQKGIDATSGAPDLISDLIGIGLGIAGGIALLLILAGSATYAMSQGDPKKATDAKETITAAIIGLLFIIFSVTILQFIGVTILRIPGF